MNQKSMLGWILVLTTVSVGCATLVKSMPAQSFRIAQAKLTEASRVGTNGIGPVLVGMTIEQASRLSGVQLVQTSSGGEEYGCYYYKPQTGQPKGVMFMVKQNHIVRIDVLRESSVMALRGVSIGDTEARIRALYPGQIQNGSPTVSGRGKNLVFVPRDSQDRNYRIIFEMAADGRVARYRAGQLPEVEWIEGCL
jgi:hypothetical protein